MIIPIALFLAAGAAKQSIACKYDRLIGPVGQFSKASVFWAYYLVTPWFPESPPKYNGDNFPSVALPYLSDLLNRMDRPIVGEILNGNLNPATGSAKDDLAAGITFWTLQWRGGNWDVYHEQATYFLSKAAHEGDAVQQSFGSLAYANSAIKQELDFASNYTDMQGVRAPAGSRERINEQSFRLKSTYNDFKTRVPERALRAAMQVVDNLNHREQSDERSHWVDIIYREFPQYRSWYYYKDNRG